MLPAARVVGYESEPLYESFYPSVDGDVMAFAGSPSDYDVENEAVRVGMGGGGSLTFRTYLRFVVSSVPDNAEIISMVFWLYLADKGDQTSNCVLNRVADSGGNSFNETWWDLASQTTYTSSFATPSSSLGWRSTTIFDSNLTASTEAIVFRLKLTSESGTLQTPYSFYSNETTSAYKPRLIVNYHVPLIAEGGVFRVDGSQVNYTVRLRYNGTATYLTSKAVTWKLYCNDTAYNSGSATTNGSGWVNFRATANLPFRRGTWELMVSDGANETIDDSITCSYLVSSENYTLTWPSEQKINSAFNFTVALNNTCTINGTAVKLNLLYVTVEAWKTGGPYISTWTYDKWTAENGTDTRDEEFANNILEGNDTIRARIYYYDNVSGNLLCSQNTTYIVTGFGGSGQNGGTNSGGSQPSQTGLPQRIAQEVATNPLVQTGLVLLTFMFVGAFVLNKVQQSKPVDRAKLRRKIQKHNGLKRRRS